VSDEARKALTEFQDRYGPSAGAAGPERFVQEQLGATPDPWQRKFLRAYGRGERRISVRSCHGPGKTAVAAWCIVHQIVTRFPQRTAVTAPTGKQLFDALFAEVKLWLKILPPVILDFFELKADRIEYKLDPEASYITARTARPENPEALQGIHSQGWVLLVADEASGVHEKIYESAAGSMSGHHATTILLSNPVRGSGFFYDTHHKLKSMWVTLHVSADDSPRVSKDFIEDMSARYGPESNAYRVRVLGEFPLADDDTIIPLELVEMSKMREVSVNPMAQVVWGLDVARFGMDKTALCKRKSNILTAPIRTWGGLDLMQTCGVVKAEWDATPESERPVEIMVDVIGLGSGVKDRLKELGLPVYGVNVSESAAMSERFVNLRTELWWNARDWFSKRDTQIIDDGNGTLSGELTSTKYKIVDSSGKLRAESKDDQKKRGLHSPDQADALILTFAGMAATAMGLRGRSDWKKPLKRGIKGIVNSKTSQHSRMKQTGCTAFPLATTVKCRGKQRRSGNVNPPLMALPPFSPAQ